MVEPRVPAACDGPANQYPVSCGRVAGEVISCWFRNLNGGHLYGVLADFLCVLIFLPRAAAAM